MYKRQPYTYARDVLTLHDLTGGRFICGIGTGGTLDAGILGDSLTVRERVDRFAEFVAVLDRLLREDHVDHRGPWFTTVDARTLPGPIRSAVPLVIAANGPRGVRLAAAYGDGWVTTGSGGDDLDSWFRGVGFEHSHITGIRAVRAGPVGDDVGEAELACATGHLGIQAT